MRAADDPAAFYTAGYSLRRPRGGHADGPLACAGRADQGGPRALAVSRAPVSCRRGWSRSAAATARCCSSSRRCGAGDVRRLRALGARDRDRPRARIPRAGRLEAYDGARVPAADGAYDLAVLSHVLEHVPDPAPLLRRGRAGRAARAGRGAARGQPLRGAPRQAGGGRAHRPPARVQPRRRPRARHRRGSADRSASSATRSRVSITRSSPRGPPRGRRPPRSGPCGPPLGRSRPRGARSSSPCTTQY